MALAASTDTAEPCTWEATLLRHTDGSRPKVAGKMQFVAASFVAAKAIIDNEIRSRSEDSDGWSLGILKPLTPNAPGTHSYDVVFAEWEADGDRFYRRDVLELTVWAADATTARRIAQTDVQEIAGYLPAWRIRRVHRTDA